MRVSVYNILPGETQTNNILPSFFQSWRRMNKKLRKQEGATKKRTKRTVKMQKAITGLTLEDIKKKHAMKKTGAVPAAKSAALKEARARQTAKQEKSAAGKAAPGKLAKVRERESIPCVTFL